MLQRIQTIYLLLTAVLATAMYFLPFSIIICKPETCSLFPYITASVVLLTTLITIFLYKNRKLQIKICIVNIIFLLLTYAEVLFGAYQKIGNWEIFRVNCIGAVLPLISIILILLAIRAIKKDENLVKAADRLR